MIRITRVKPYGELFRTYKIFIDGVYRDEIAIKETKEFEVGNGKHTVYAKIDWYKSNTLCVNVDDSIVDLEVGSSVVGWRLLLSMLYATVWARKYLWLREKETADALSENAE